MKNSLVRSIYFYGFALIGLLLIVIGTVRLIDLGLKVYVFKEADTYIYYPEPALKVEGQESTDISQEERERIKEEREEANAKNTKSRRQATASSSVAMLIVGLPLFGYHWRTVRADRS